MGHKKATENAKAMKVSKSGKGVDIPPNWRSKCHKDHAWCVAWRRQLTYRQQEQINCGKPLGPLSTHAQELIETHCKTEFPKDAKKRANCIGAHTLLKQVKHCKGRKRAANLAPESGSRVEVYLGLGALLLIILGAMVAAWYLFGGGASGRQGAKGPRKGQSKSGKSKRGKSKIGSRKSSHRSSRKGSQRSKGTKSRLSAKK